MEKKSQQTIITFIQRSTCDQSLIIVFRAVPQNPCAKPLEQGRPIDKSNELLTSKCINSVSRNCASLMNPVEIEKRDKEKNNSMTCAIKFLKQFKLTSDDMRKLVVVLI